MASFPRGRAGAGLLMLRVAASVSILVGTGDEMLNGHATFLSVMLSFLAISVGMGLFTTVTSSIATLLKIGLSLTQHNSPLLTTIMTAEVCIALTMTGAGAYSLDALLFGYRRVTLPK